MPDIEPIKFELEMRNLIDIETQSAILDELRRIAPLKVWLGIRWLSIYVSIRPGELIDLRERDVNVKLRAFLSHARRKKSQRS